jgi:hypothetical protein
MSSNELIDQRDLLFDKIEKYYKGEVNLSDNESLICERWELAFALLQKHRSKSIAIQKYLKLLESRGTPISKNTAYIDFKKAELIFTPINKVSKDLQRLIIIESIDRDIAALKKKQQKGDISEKSYLAFQVEINKLYDLRIKAGGLHQEDPNVPDFSLVQMPDIQVNISPKLEQILRKLTINGAVDTTEIFRNLTEEAEIIIPTDEEDSENS